MKINYNVFYNFKVVLYAIIFFIGILFPFSLHADITYPTDPPPSSSADDITVRGLQYTAVGYDYSSILEDGQEFENCVFNPADGYIYVIDNNNMDQGGDTGFKDQILVIDPEDGTILNGFNLPNPDGDTHSYCLTIGDTGNLFFRERGHTDIYEITTDGAVLGSYSIDTTPAAPWPGVQQDGIGYNPNTDTYYITESNFSRVTRDSDGHFIKHESYETRPYGCWYPHGIVYDAINNTLLIIDNSTDQIYEFGLDGTFIAGGADETRTVDMPEYFDRARGIAFDPATARIFLSGTDTYAQHNRAIITVLTPVDPLIPEVSGDVDGNSAVNRDDIFEIINCLYQPVATCPKADIDGDGRITVLDARKVVLLCDRPYCATEECFSFQNESPPLDVSRQMTQVSVQSFFEYTAGADHSTSVSFDLFLDGSLFAKVGPVPIGGSSGPIALPADVGSHLFELRNVACPEGVGSCIDGTVDSWGGTVCISP